MEPEHRFEFMGIFTEERGAVAHIEHIKTGELKAGSGTLYIVEGNPAENELRVVPSAQAVADNYTGFKRQVGSGFQYMGIFTEEAMGKAYIEKIRERVRDETGKRLF